MHLKNCNSLLIAEFSQYNLGMCDEQILDLQPVTISETVVRS